MLRVFGTAIALAGLGLLTLGLVRPPKNTFAIQDLPVSRDLPTPSHIVEGWVTSGDWAATRRHSWALWAAMTAPSRSVWNGRRLPIWETWYSVPEVFGAGSKPPRDREPAFFLGRPTQVQLAQPDGQGPAAALFAFVKYNRAAAEHVWRMQYHRRSTLDSLQARFDREQTPTELRSINPFPREAITLKPVFWLAKQAKRSPNGLHALPYWDPTAPPPAGGVTPDHRTWRKMVAIDPDQRHPEGSLQPVVFRGQTFTAPVVYLSRFYSVPLRDAEEVAAVRFYARELSSAGGEQERMITNPGDLPEIGDTIIFLAMHVTTKEMDNWTFQTFYWMPNPDAGPYGADRPASVRGVWRNYIMCNSYSMTSPPAPNGGLHVCFNPYLETDLGPTKAVELSGKTYGPDPMAGTFSNCMSCHNRAGYPAFDSKNPFSANMGGVRNDGYRAPNDPYFKKMTKVDFLWSVALHAGK